MWLRRLFLFASQSSIITETASKVRTEAINKIGNSHIIKRYRYIMYGNVIISTTAIIISIIALIK